MVVARRSSLLVAAVTATLTVGFATAVTAPVRSAPAPTADDAPVLLTPKGEHEDGSEDQTFDKLRDAYYASRVLSGDQQLTLTQAASLRTKATGNARSVARATKPGAGRGGTWVNQGPDPIVQVVRTSNTFAAMSGRVGALAIRNNGTIILGAAQGGVWTYDASAGTWTSRTNDSDTQSVGALAIAPSNDSIVYMGSGEGTLAGDSYYGDGVYRSTDGGVSWQHVSTLFSGQAVSDLVVDPANPQHVYASTLRGRGGAHRTTSPTGVQYGVWESTDGGVTWTLRKGTSDEFHGATDLVMDPQQTNVLWASFWGDGIYRSTDGGRTWASALGDLPGGDYNAGGSRFSLGLSHPAGAASATVYAGFDYFDTAGHYHSARVYKTTTDGTHWTDATGTTTGSNSVVGYCGTQCFYDNEVKPDPTDPNTVYALGSYGYGNSPQSGGIYRSTDGGATWKNLGYDLHPDFHAIAFQANNTKHIAIGNDGGVWQSSTGGGRLGATDPLKSADWEDLNGQVNPNTGALIHSTGLAIGQFTSIATVPAVPGQYWAGLQDNGTLRKSTLNNRWFDQASGDGGQVIVDQTTANPYTTNYPAFVFGSYYGISPYRYDPAHVNTFFGNEAIDGGIDTHDRAEFYVPWVQNRGNVNQMFLGTYRLYRSDNVEAPSGGDVSWAPVSGDLTSGCSGSAPNGARGCLISAIGVADGGTGVYVGTDEGWIQVSPDAVDSDTPTWNRTGVGTLPDRPVNQIVTDRSNWRVAYAAYGGFGAATPGNSGHVFATVDGGTTWVNVTSNLPDAPVNSLVVDPSDSRIVYAGTDVGAFVSLNAGGNWNRLGTGLPQVAVWQLDYDASHGLLAAGTHGRGAYTLQNRSALPALVASTSDTGAPVGPGSNLTYTVTVRNIGNAAATGMTVKNPLPAYTTPVSADAGGRVNTGIARWDNVTVPAGGSVALHFTVRISPTLPGSVTAIVDDGLTVSSDQRVSTSGSPHRTPIAPAYAVGVAPASGTEGAKVGSQTTFVEHVSNEGYRADSYSLATSGGSWTATVYDATCTTPAATTPTVASGATVDVCVKVDVPAGSADAAHNDTTLTVTSTGGGSVSATATLTSLAVSTDVLLVDGDGNGPDTSSYYKAALTSAGAGFSTWDLAAEPDLPQSYLTAHKTVVWYTGNSYPAPIAPYEPELKALLDGGGRLFLSGQDILDQAAGTTPFVRDYLHVDWDGTETQNDRATATVTGVAGNPVTDGIGSVPLNHAVLGANFEDQVTPIGPATAAFTDATATPDALTVADGPYKVAFLAFPFEAYGSAAQQADLMQRALTWFGTP